MTDWEPATEAEAAMRDALRSNDQQLYFRILSRVELLLPISTQATAGHAPAGWGTWTTGGRTHVLAFTSIEAIRACLGEHAVPNRRIGYPELATNWPNHEWWLAVNPGLPIEGYLPAWYVSQLSRGDVRLPGRTVGARARLERVEALNRSREAGPAASVAPATPTPAAPTPPPARRPADVGPSPAPPPVVPAAFHLPEVPVTPSTLGVPHRGRPAGSAPEHPDGNRIAPDGPRPTGGSRPAAFGGERPEAAAPARPAGLGPSLGGVRPDGPGKVPPRRPMPFRTEEVGAPERGWPAAPERPGPATNGRPTEPGVDQPSRRSFFEPAAERPASRSDRLADRATPPSRFGRGGQPFPRRGPAAKPAGAGDPRAFVFTDDDRPVDDRSAGAARPGSGGEATQPLPSQDASSSDPTRPLGLAGRMAPPGMDRADTEATQALPRRRPTEDAAQAPPSIAEPVSGPPATRRGFTPIVIEGTIIEARDLSTAPSTEERSHPSAGESPTARPEAERTMPGPRVEPEPTVPLTPEPTADAQAEPTAPIFPVAAEPTAPIFPVAAEPTAPIFPVAAEPTAPIFPVAAEPTAPIFPVAAEPTARISPVAAEPTAPISQVPTQPVAAEPTEPISQVPTQPVAAEPTEPIFPVAAEPLAGARAEPTVPVAPEPVAAGQAESTVPTQPVAAEPTVSTQPVAAEPTVVVAEFQPANGVEEELLSAADAGNTDTFLSTLLLARVLMPVAADSAPGSRPGEPGFVWPAVQLDGQTFVLGYTSPQRFADHTDPAADTIQVRFVQLIRQWPDPSWSFAVNPGTPVGAKLPGEQIVGLANWATELGLGDDPENEPEPSAEPPAPSIGQRKATTAADPARPIVMQKAIAPSQLGYYLERGYDRVSGFVHRATELAHLTTPAQLYRALGLHHPESPFDPGADEIYVLRWPAYRPSLYRIPYGGQNEAAMRAMEGWVIERPPFRGNGFAPGESSDVLAEFKVDSVRLPHGAQLLRLGADGTERLVAVLDADTLSWQRVGEQ
ncbi:SseB family protein [Micromonospora sp. FIMYZ51]|uniref:SseB family protein n=1 Tax=Micromonospora sp. FIMYZ51 TaxID=3051832 RepID=UPI00311F8925